MLEHPYTIEVLQSSALFIVMWFVLGRLVFKPFFNTLEERESRTVGDEKRAKEIREQNVRLQENINKTVEEARLEGIAARDEIVLKAKEEAAKIVGQANKAAEAKISAAREEIRQTISAQEPELAREAASIASVIADRAVSTSKQASVH